MSPEVPKFRHEGDLNSPPVVFDPFCAFHGKRMSEHEGGRCLYCCICFKLLEPEDCVMDVSGQKWDVCQGQCAVDAGIQEKEKPSEPLAPVGQ